MDFDCDSTKLYFFGSGGKLIIARTLFQNTLYARRIVNRRSNLRALKDPGARSAPGGFWGVWGPKVAKTNGNEAMRRAKCARVFWVL